MLLCTEFIGGHLKVAGFTIPNIIILFAAAVLAVIIAVLIFTGVVVTRNKKKRLNEDVKMVKPNANNARSADDGIFMGAAIRKSNKEDKANNEINENKALFEDNLNDTTGFGGLAKKFLKTDISNLGIPVTDFSDIDSKNFSIIAGEGSWQDVDDKTNDILEYIGKNHLADEASLDLDGKTEELSDDDVERMYEEQAAREEAEKAEAERIAEEKRIAEEIKATEARRKAAEARRLEEIRKAEEAALATPVVNNEEIPVVGLEEEEARKAEEEAKAIETAKAEELALGENHGEANMLFDETDFISSIDGKRQSAPEEIESESFIPVVKSHENPENTSSSDLEKMPVVQERQEEFADEVAFDVKAVVSSESYETVTENEIADEVPVIAEQAATEIAEEVQVVEQAEDEIAEEVPVITEQAEDEIAEEVQVIEQAETEEAIEFFADTVQEVPVVNPIEEEYELNIEDGGTSAEAKEGMDCQEAATKAVDFDMSDLSLDDIISNENRAVSDGVAEQSFDDAAYISAEKVSQETQKQSSESKYSYDDIFSESDESGRDILDLDFVSEKSIGFDDSEITSQVGVSAEESASFDIYDGAGELDVSDIDVDDGDTIITDNDEIDVDISAESDHVEATDSEKNFLDTIPTIFDETESVAPTKADIIPTASQQAEVDNISANDFHVSVEDTGNLFEDKTESAVSSESENNTAPEQESNDAFVSKAELQSDTACDGISVVEQTKEQLPENAKQAKIEIAEEPVAEEDIPTLPKVRVCKYCKKRMELTNGAYDCLICHKRFRAPEDDIEKDRVYREYLARVEQNKQTAQNDTAIPDEKAEKEKQAEAERIERERQAEIQKAAEEAHKAEEARQELIRQEEIQRIAEEARKAEEARQELIRQQELQRIAEEARKAEEARQERIRQEEIQRIAEEAKKADEARVAQLKKAEEERAALVALEAERRIEAERLAKEAQLAKEARERAEAARIEAEKARQAELQSYQEQLKQAELARMEEMNRAAEEAKLAEAKRIEEQKQAEIARKEELEKVAEQARKTEAERYKLRLEQAEQQRIIQAAHFAEEARLEAEARRAAEAELERMEAERAAAEALQEQQRQEEEARRKEAERIAEEARRRKEEDPDAEDEDDAEPDEGNELSIEPSVYKRSFRSKLIQGSDLLKKFYSDIRNELLSYNKIRLSVAFGADSFLHSRTTLAKLVLGGKTLCLFLALNPDDFNPTIFRQKDKRGSKKYGAVPMMLRVKSELGMRRAISLIATMMADNSIEKKSDFQPVDYIAELAAKTDEELLALGLIRLNSAAAETVGQEITEQDIKEEEQKPKSFREVATVKKQQIGKLTSADVKKIAEKADSASIVEEKKNTTKTGKYVITASGAEFKFTLFSVTGRKLFESRAFKTVQGARKAIDSFRTAVMIDANITLSLADGKFFYTIRANNTYSSEPFPTKLSCTNALNAIRKTNETAIISE